MTRLNSLAFKDHLRETLIFNRRALVAAFVTTLLLVVLVVRLVYLQITNQQHFSTLSENNRVNILPIPPTRGLIYDRNGVLLAQNLPSFTLTLVPEHIENLGETLKILGQKITLTEEDIARFHKNRKQKRRFEGIPIRFRLSDEEVARIAVDQYRLPGVEIRAELARHYPLGSLASHAVGYVARINEQELLNLDVSNYSATTHIGKVGVELTYENILHGQVGFQRVETNAQGRILHVLERTLPVPGKNLYLNLDARLQSIAEKEFKDNSGALVALDPRNGAVLALVSMPTYDPNLFINGIDSKTYNALTSSPDQPLFNRAIHGQYPPGSTIKPFIGLAGLELEQIQADKTIRCPGWYMLKNDERRYRDWKKEGHGETDLTKAIVESCDVYFYDLSLALGVDRLHQFLSTFGLGQRTGIDLQGELAGLLPSSEWKHRTYNQLWYPGETLITGIGQGFMLTTPLQLASITATLSQRGLRQRPRMVYGIENADDHTFTLTKTKPYTQGPSAGESNWSTIIDAMRKVVHSIRGTARGISYNLKYSIAAKTGTAQVFGIKQDEEYVEEDVSKKLRDHALFISFAPIENPKIAVGVIVENGGSGGAVAAPIVRKMMDYYLLESDKPNESK